MGDFGKGYSIGAFGTFSTVKEGERICRFDGLITLHWGFMADGSGEYAIHIDNSISCEPPPCNPTTMQGGSLWNFEVTQSKSGLTGDITLKKVQCCGDCEPTGWSISEKALFQRDEHVVLKAGKKDGPSFLRNLRNTILEGDTPGVVDDPSMVVIRRQLLTHVVVNMGMHPDDLMNCANVNLTCRNLWRNHDPPF